MKKQLIIAALLLCSLSIFAQEGSQNIGFTIGYASPILRERSTPKDTVLSQKTKLNGFTAGLVYETTFVKGFGLQMGLRYTFGARGGDWRSVNTSLTYPKTKDTYVFHEIAVPIEWQYKFTIAKETYLLLYTGPSICYNAAFTNNHYTQKTPANDPTLERINKYKVDADNDGHHDYSQLNITWGVGAGFQYKQYFLRGGYDFGIMSCYSDRVWNNYQTDYDFNRRGRMDQWSIRLGMYLWQF